MIELDSFLNEIFGSIKIFIPVLIGFNIFFIGFRLILRSVYAPSHIYDVPKYVNKKPVKLDKKYYPKKYDIPDKQRDFIQLN